jgi:hypothetical protein
MHIILDKIRYIKKLRMEWCILGIIIDHRGRHTKGIATYNAQEANVELFQ